MKDQYIYFVCLVGNKELLKAEIAIRFKLLALSFSKANFLTYKNKGDRVSESELKSLQFAFAVDWGFSPSPISDDFIEEKLLQTNFNEDEPMAPSRAYYKIKQACGANDLKADSSINWLDIGSAPGGSSYFLLQHFGKVVGIDSAQMDPICINNPNFLFINKAIQKVSVKDLADFEIHWIACDLNLHPKQAINSALKIAKNLNKLKGMYFTVKMVKKELVDSIAEFKKLFEKNGWSQIKIMQLPAHHKEFLLVARR